MRSRSRTTTGARRSNRRDLPAPSLSEMRRPPTHPGEIFYHDFLNPTGVSQAEAAARMGMSENRLNEIIAGKRSVTAETAVLFAAFTQTDPLFWMRLQASNSVWHALQTVDTSKIKKLTAA